MKYMEKYSRRFFFILFSFVFANFVFSQSADQGPVENQDTIIDVESEKSDDKNIIDSLQRNFTIITAQQPWNLDIHTATYSSEAQIMDSLYEGTS